MKYLKMFIIPTTLLGRICNLPTILRDFKKFTSKAVPNITVAIGSALKGGESL